MLGWFKKKRDTQGYTLKDLAIEVIAESEKRYPKDKFTYDESMNTVVSAGGDGAQTFLGNIFNVVKDMSPDERQAYIEDFFNAVVQTSDDLTLETLNAYLMTRVRTSSEIGLRNLTLDGRGSDKDFFTIRVGSLLFDLTVDYGTTIQTPTKSTLTDVGGGDEAVLNLALQNLKNISDDSPWESLAPHIWASKYEDDYDAARLICLYPEYRLPDGVESPVVYMPSHNVCLIADSDDPETLKLLVEKGDGLAGEARKLSSALWHNVGSGWEVLDLDKGHPSYELVRRRALMEVHSFYTEQKALLENIFEKESQDIFVASVLLYEEQEDESIFSCSVLSFGVDTLLPKTEKVGIVDPDKPEKTRFLGMLGWDEFVALIGPDKLTPYGSLDPVRYDFTGRLDENDFNKIRDRLS